MKKHNLLLAGSITVGLAFTGATIYSGIKSHEIREAHQRRGGEMSNHFKACPDQFRAAGDCYTVEERNQMITEAEGHRNAGRVEEAGILFDRVRREGDAREMAGRCGISGNGAGRDRILYELRLRTEAGTRARGPTQ